LHLCQKLEPIFSNVHQMQKEKKWIAAVLDCGGSVYGTIDSYAWLYDFANAPKLDPKACQVDALGGTGKCKSLVFKNSYCILHYLLIAQQRDAPQWMPVAIAKQCPGCGVAFPRGAKVKKTSLSILCSNFL